jgi:hypothetical protein
MRFVTRPLPAVWPTGRRTPAAERQWGRFKAPWSSTMELLERELRHLQAVEPVVIEAGYRERDIRLDGRPRTGAKLDDPAVVVSFESRFGPLRYGCDTFHEHAANLRAIALTLQHLRAVDRYGVTKRGEQYQGWSALPPPGDPRMSAEEAKAFIRHHSGVQPDDTGASLRELYRRAARRLHPDVGGDPVLMSRLNQAAEVVGL